MAQRTDKLGRPRRPGQDQTTFRPARQGAFSRSHNVNTTSEVHAAFAKLSPQERGDLIERALTAPAS